MRRPAFLQKQSQSILQLVTLQRLPCMIHEGYRAIRYDDALCCAMLCCMQKGLPGEDSVEGLAGEAFSASGAGADVVIGVVADVPGRHCQYHSFWR